MIKKNLMPAMIRCLLTLTIAACGIQAQAQRTININSTVDFRQYGSLPSTTFQATQCRRLEANPLLKNFSQDNIGDTLLLDFFDDCRYKAIVKQVSQSYDGIVGITAQLTETEWGYCFISISDEGAEVSVELPFQDKYFSTKKRNGELYLFEQPLSEMYRNMHDHDDCNHTEPATLENHISGKGSRAALRSLPPSNSPVTIDLMILYTPAAKTWAIQNGKNIDDMISTAMLRCNTVMTNSLTNVTFNLVYKQEIDYTESTSSLNTDLNRLRNPDDGYIDEAHALRSYYKADMVALLVGEAVQSNVSGVGYVLGDEYGSTNSGLSVAKVRYIADSYTLIHEIGHNFGCGHHLDTDQVGIYSYSHGWRGIASSNKKFSTIMTYENTTGQNYPRIPFFSDPNLMFEGVAIGDVNNANNALTIRQTKLLIADYSNEIVWTDAFLKNINVSEGTLTPTFNPGVKNYTVEVGNNVKNIDVEGIKNSPHATVSGNVNGQPLVVGDNTIKIKVEDGWNNFEKFYTVTVKRQNSSMTSQEKVDAPEKNWAYPNPVRNGLLTIDNRLLTAGELIAIYTMDGRRVKTQQVNSEAVTVLDVSNLQPGNYFLKAGKKALKIIIIH